MLPGKLCAQHDCERNLQFLEQPTNAWDAPVDRVLTKGLVHEVRVAGYHVRAVDRALTEAELLNEQRKTNSHLFAAGPRRHMDWFPREAGHRISHRLRRSDRRKQNGEQRR